jgi:hypothetical protein
MNTDQKIIRNKVGLLKLAERLGSVSDACKTMGYSRGSFYRFKELSRIPKFDIRVAIAGSPYACVFAFIGRLMKPHHPSRNHLTRPFLIMRRLDSLQRVPGFRIPNLKPVTTELPAPGRDWTTGHTTPTVSLSLLGTGRSTRTKDCSTRGCSPATTGLGMSRV